MHARILVAGDVMLDRYWYGDVTRLSQEAPVPVVKMLREECRAGAAANVAMNCASLGKDVTLIGITGSDESENQLRNCLTGRIYDALLSDDRIATTQKIRIIGRHQQITRVDIDGHTESNMVTEAALQRIPDHDIIVFSDYGKGALNDVQNLIQYAKRLGKTVLVDPKGHDYSRYSGADIVKPNLDEIREMTGGWSCEEQLNNKINKIRTEANIGMILLTRGPGGMTLYDGDVFHINSTAKEVYDVTGAGDTVMATIAVMLTKGMDLKGAARAANYAAGVVVGKFGTSTVSELELEKAMNEPT